MSSHLAEGHGPGSVLCNRFWGLGGGEHLMHGCEGVLLHGCTENKQSASLRGDFTVSGHSLDHDDLWVPRDTAATVNTHTRESSSFPEKVGC